MYWFMIVPEASKRDPQEGLEEGDDGWDAKQSRPFYPCGDQQNSCEAFYKPVRFLALFSLMASLLLAG